MIAQRMACCLVCAAVVCLGGCLSEREVPARLDLKATHDDGSAVANAVVSYPVDSRSEAARILGGCQGTEIRTDDEGLLQLVVCATEIPRGLFRVSHTLDPTILVALERDTGDEVFVLTAPDSNTRGFLAFLGVSDSVKGVTLAFQGVDYTGGTQAELAGRCPPRIPEE
jgi:hypothetical protein